MKSRYTDAEPGRIWGKRGKEGDVDELLDGDGLAMANETVDSHPPGSHTPKPASKIRRQLSNILINRTRLGHEV
jgi:hypothetical protein